MNKIKLLAVFAALLLPLALNAQKHIFEPVVLTIDKQNGQYAKGEQVNVYAELTAEVSEPVMVTVTAAGKKISEETVSLKMGEKTVVHTATWDEPKSVIVKVYAQSNPKVFTAVGYIVAPEEFTPGYEEPSDLQDYWKKQIATMRKTKAKAKTESVTEEFKGSDKVDCWSLEINMPEGNPVRAYVAIPKGASAKSLPIYIHAHAAGVNKKGCSSSPAKAASFAKAGAIAIDINAHGMLNGQDQSYYDDLYNGELKSYSTRELTNREDYYFRLMYLRLVRALDYLVTLPEWDGKRVLIAGGSQGGGQATALAGIDSRVTAACIAVPALNDLGAYKQGRVNGWPLKKKLYRKGEQKELAARILPYFDGALLIKYSKAKLFYEVGLIDETCDPACVFASFNNAGSSDKQIYSFPYRPHSKMNKRYDAEYKEQVETAKKKFVDDFIKGR